MDISIYRLRGPREREGRPNSPCPRELLNSLPGVSPMRRRCRLPSCITKAGCSDSFLIGLTDIERSTISYRFCQKASRFLPQCRGDERAESFTHAEASSVISQ